MAGNFDVEQLESRMLLTGNATAFSGQWSEYGGYFRDSLPYEEFLEFDNTIIESLSEPFADHIAVQEAVWEHTAEDLPESVLTRFVYSWTSVESGPEISTVDVKIWHGFYDDRPNELELDSLQLLEVSLTIELASPHSFQGVRETDAIPLTLEHVLDFRQSSYYWGENISSWIGPRSIHFDELVGVHDAETASYYWTGLDYEDAEVRGSFRLVSEADEFAIGDETQRMGTRVTWRACDLGYDPGSVAVESITADGRSGDDNDDGLIDWAGRYIGGVDHNESIEVNIAEGTPRSVRFELVSDEHEQVVIDENGNDGWSFSPDIHALTKDATVEITVLPVVGSSITHTLTLLVADPGILQGHDGTWDPDTDEYEFKLDESLFGGDAFNLDAASLLEGEVSDEEAALFEVAFWQFGVDIRAIETVSLSMDPAQLPRLTDYSVVTTGTGFGDRELFRHEKPLNVDAGQIKLSFSITPPRPGFLSKAKLSFSFTGKYSWELQETDNGIHGWRQVDVGAKARLGFSYNSDYKQIAPIGTTGLALWGRAGVKIDAGGGVTLSQRITSTAAGGIENNSDLSGSLEARLIPSVSAVFSLYDPFGGVIEWAELWNVGVRLEGVFTANKSYTGIPGEDREWTASLDGRIRVSLIGSVLNWSGSIVLWTFGPVELIDGLNGPDPVIDTALVNAGQPTLVTLESPTLDSTPYVVTQTWNGSRWSDGDILADDGRAKFGVDAAALGEGLGVVYSGSSALRDSFGYEGANPQAFVDDTELWWSRDGGDVQRLTTNSNADLSPRLVFSEDGLSGMLVWIRVTRTLADPVSQVMYRLWDGESFGAETAMADPGRVADPQARRLADGRFAVNWRDQDGTLHTRVSGAEWESLVVLASVGEAYDVLEIDGVLHAMVTVGDGGQGYAGLKLYRYEGGGWTDLGELSPYVSNITSLDARADGNGNIVVGLTTADGEVNAVYSGLVPLDDLAADVFVRADGGDWQAGDVSVLPDTGNRYHLAYGLFPTSLDQTEPPASEIRRAPGSRLASGVHLIDGTPIRDSRVGGLSGSGGSLSLIALTDSGVAVYERGADIGSEAQVLDLGVSDAFAADTWTDGGDARYVILSPGKVQVWIDGALTDLTGSLGAEPIAEHLTVFTARDGRVFLAGMTEAGELVAYSEKDGVWNFRNISIEDLAPQEIDTPVFAGKIASYVTRWNGLNIAGIDANGDIQGIWWAPGLERWTVSNLSEITGAPLSVGNLAVTLTPWGGINLAATSIDGRLRVTWWVPSFGGSWVVSDLTQNADGVGLQLRPETTFGYTTPWGALNFGGIDQRGELVVFWWVPGRQAWTPAELSEPGNSPYSDLHSLVSTTGETSIVGQTEQGEVVRFWWLPGADGWTSEIVTV